MFPMILLAVLFFGLWIAGLVTSYTMGGFVHVLLILGLVVLINGMIRSNSSKLSELQASPPDSAQR
jgi:ABC-type uncharacterized transport system permease subunit